MIFARKEFAASGQAALALTVSLLEWLEHNGTIIPADKAKIIQEALALAPNGVGRIDEEARDILRSLGK